MAIQEIILGNYANDGTGDDLRTAFQKVNANFEQLAGGVIATGTNLGPSTGNIGRLFAQANLITSALEFKTLTSTDNSVELTSTSTTVNLKSKSPLLNDISPQLGGDLELNGFNIVKGSEGNGDVQTSVFGIDVRTLNSLVELLLTSNNTILDFGTFLSPTYTSYDVNMNGINLDAEGFSLFDPAGLNLDFGAIV
jgi:hypothetical protein